MNSRVSASKAIFEVFEGPHRGVRLELDQHDSVLVGRGSEARLRLIDDPHFSRHHFLLEVNPPRVLLRDLGSRNGTLVNDQLVKQCHPNSGDVISGGQTRIRFTLADPADLQATAGLPAPNALSETQPFAEAPGTRRPPNDIVAPIVPGYEIQHRLGQGGMGTVYRAIHLASQDVVAVKFVIPEAAGRDSLINRFLREARVLSQLDHPRIVRFREVGLHLGQFFFAMEYVETANLKTLLRSLAPSSRVRLCAAILAQALEGLHFAHMQGVVHRDVKPSNLLIHRTGSKLYTKLADFGLAKHYQNAGLSGMTHEGQGLGTIPFMAPEQIVSARTALPAVDIYSAGATLYYLLAEKYPFIFSNDNDPLRVVLESDPMPLAEVCPWVPPGLSDVVHRALARQAQDRFPNAEAFRQALQPFAKVSISPR